MIVVIFTVLLIACMLMTIAVAIKHTNSNDPTEKVEMYGYDLAKWNYMGWRALTFFDPETEKTTSECVVHFFVGKDSTSLRAYKAVSSGFGSDVKKFLDGHSFFPKYAEPWRAGGLNMWTMVSHPSDWSKEYLNERGFKWSTEKRTWVVKDESEDWQISGGPDSDFSSGELVESTDNGSELGG